MKETILINGAPFYGDDDGYMVGPHPPLSVNYVYPINLHVQQSLWPVGSIRALASDRFQVTHALWWPCNVEYSEPYPEYPTLEDAVYRLKCDRANQVIEKKS